MARLLLLLPLLCSCMPPAYDPTGRRCVEGVRPCGDERFECIAERCTLKGSQVTPDGGEPVSEANVLTNGSFEQGMFDAPGWNASAGANLYVSSFTPKEGQKVLMVSGGGGEPVLLQPSSDPVQPSVVGARYCAVAYVSGNSTRFRLSVVERSSPENVVRSAEVGGAALGWTEVTASLVAQGAAPLTLELLLSPSSGSLQGMVDDVRLWRTASGACSVR